MFVKSSYLVKMQESVYPWTVMPTLWTLRIKSLSMEVFHPLYLALTIVNDAFSKQVMEPSFPNIDAELTIYRQIR